jgi:hypothetical protein
MRLRLPPGLPRVLGQAFVLRGDQLVSYSGRSYRPQYMPMQYQPPSLADLSQAAPAMLVLRPPRPDRVKSLFQAEQPAIGGERVVGCGDVNRYGRHANG